MERERNKTVDEKRFALQREETMQSEGLGQVYCNLTERSWVFSKGNTCTFKGEYFMVTFTQTSKEELVDKMQGTDSLE